LQEVDALPDPCPTPQQGTAIAEAAAAADAASAGGGNSAAAAPAARARRRSLQDKERLIHAPMSDVGGMLFDKDAVYIDLPDWKVSRQHTGCR
jgi:ribosome biogenesis protein BMS1